MPDDFFYTNQSMITKDIVQKGNSLLDIPSKFVTNPHSKATQRVIKNLIDSNRHHNLTGMAANQIGEKLRIFVTEVRKTPYRNPKEIDKLRIFINPKITWKSKKQVTMYEGCGSVAYSKLFAPIKRPEKIILEALDEKNNKFRLKASGLLARVIQHEYDHLNGVEFTERITDIKTVMSSGEYLKRISSKKV